MRRVKLPCVLALVAVIAAAGCGGGASTPTAPAPLPPPVAAVPPPAVTVPAPPGGLSVGAMVMKDRTAVISWAASSGATEYAIEVGGSPGATDSLQSAGTATSFTLSALRAGRTYVRIKAGNSAGTSVASAELTVVLPDLGDYVEALFLGSGPLIPAERSFDPGLSCPRRGMWSGFPRGATVRNIVSAQIPAQYRDAIRAVTDLIPEVTAGRLATTFEVVQDVPRATDNQMLHVALQTSAELRDACGSQTGTACLTYNSRPFDGGVIRWSAGYYVVPNIPFPQPYGHEPGHGILGMCHISADAIGGHERSMMSTAEIAGNQSPRLTPFDIEALKAVYGSTLNPGARRADFVAAGLLRP